MTDLAPSTADRRRAAGGDASRGHVTVAAVDLGASSGRVMLAHVGPDRLDLEEVHRFDNEPVELDGTLFWDVLALWRGVVAGLRKAVGQVERLHGIGIDSWAVDHGLLDRDGRLLGNPVHYRDARTEGSVDAVVELLGRDRLYATTGIQVIPINTIFQLHAALGTAQLEAAESLLLIPDLLAHWLTGRRVAERTNASTTALFDATTRQWSDGLLDELGLQRGLFAELVDPGDEIGPLHDVVRERLGLADDAPDVPVIAVGSHDTASAVVGVPADGGSFAYVSCGTWALVGVELDDPVLSEASREANFTNELGVDGTVRYLRNVMGLWLLSESQRAWEERGEADDLQTLLAEAGGVEPLRSLVNPDDARFLPPGDMPSRIAEVCEASGQPVPSSPAEVTRCILDSLAVAFARTVERATALSGRDVGVVHVVGGGSRNELLCQLTADACGLPVLAGPAEATAIGNALVQARALGALHGGLDELRGLVRRTQELRRHEPRNGLDWAAATERVVALTEGGEATT